MDQNVKEIQHAVFKNVKPICDALTLTALLIP